MIHDSTVLCLTVGRVDYDYDINFHEPLTRLFSRVIRYNYRERTASIGRDAMNRELLEFAGAEKPRYVFFITSQDQIKLETLQALREIGCLVVAWFSDDHSRFDNYSRFIASHIHCSITTDTDAYEKYRQLRLPSVLTQWAANPDYYHALQLPRTIDVSFVGEYGGRGRRIIDRVIAGGKQPEIIGSGSSAVHELDDTIRIFNQSRICMHTSSISGSSPAGPIDGSIFEIPMCGGFLLTENSSGLGEYFRKDSEIAVFSDEQEGLDKLQYYLAHDDERERIALAGHRRAQKEHRWDLRLQSVFQTIEKEFGPADSGIHASGVPRHSDQTAAAHQATLESLCTPGDLVFDIGSHTDATTETYVKRGIRVVCFEPQPVCVHTFEQQLSAPSLTGYIGKDLTSRPETLELFLCSASPTLSTFSDTWTTGRFSHITWDRRVPADTTTLDEAINRYGTPAYCKIDVEGFELEVLTGLSRTAGILSFAFTRELIDTARKCIDRCVTVGYKKFNFVIGEETTFFLPEWTGPAVLISRIDGITDLLLRGTIYAG